MSKIFLSGDWHFGVYPIQVDKWLKMQKNYFYNQFIPDLKANYQEGDIFIHGGDLYDNRTYIPIIVKHEVEKLIMEIQSILPVYLIVGNHDMALKSTKNNIVSSVRSLSWLPNVKVINTPTTIDFDNNKIVMMPYYDKKDDMIEAIDNNQGDFLICHSDLNGCRMHLNSVAHKNLDKITVDSFKSYKHVYSSHIHIRQVMENFTFIDSPYEMDRNDRGDTKGMTILYPSENRTEFIPNKISPIFEKIIIKAEKDIDLLENVNKFNYIDLEIYNSVIVSSRKIRKKIEAILETGGFAKVDYINDLVKKEEVTDQKAALITESIDFVELKKGGDINYDTVIQTYMQYLDYETDEIKEGVLKEFDTLKEKYQTIYGKKV